MFQGFSPETITFLKELRLNNNRDWFQSNKPRFQEKVQLPMKELGLEVYEQMKATYPDHGFIHRLSRIYRDARRVRDGQPYHVNLWFSIELPNVEFNDAPVFWFDISPESWSYGLGFYQARPSTMAKLRARIDRDPSAFEAFVAPLLDQKEFEIDGEEYKRKKEAPSPGTAAWYNRKSLALAHYQANGEELFDEDIALRIVAGYQSLMPFYDYFLSIANDPEPKK